MTKPHYIQNVTLSTGAIIQVTNHGKMTPLEKIEHRNFLKKQLRQIRLAEQGSIEAAIALDTCDYFSPWQVREKPAKIYEDDEKRS